MKLGRFGEQDRYIIDIAISVVYADRGDRCTDQHCCFSRLDLILGIPI